MQRSVFESLIMLEILAVQSPSRVVFRRLLPMMPYSIGWQIRVYELAEHTKSALT